MHPAALAVLLLPGAPAPAVTLSLDGKPSVTIVLADDPAPAERTAAHELADYLAAADILLSPRLGSVNTPLKLLDYLKAGRAIVATATAANRMVVGETNKGKDVPFNVCRKKHLTNVRAARGDMEIRLTPPRKMSLDESIEYLADDELLEVTPLSYRIRKRILSIDDRGKQLKRDQEAMEE